VSLPSDNDDIRFIWATRGRSWGFRFLRNGGLGDPLRTYEDAFAEVGDRPEAWRRGPGMVALRFPDPEARRDASGRVIPHDLVLLGDWADDLDSFEAGQRRMWNEIASDFEDAWDEPEPPPSRP